MIRDPQEYVENARLALGTLTNVKACSVFLSQRKTSGFRGSSTGEQIDPSNDRDYGLRLWIQKDDGQCYFALLPLGDAKQLRSEIKSLHQGDHWKLVAKEWPFSPIDEECYRNETSYRDPQIDIVELSEVEGRFRNLARRLREATAAPIRSGLIEEYVFKYRMIENEECFWTTGSRRPISHQSSRFVIDMQAKVHGFWLGEGFEEAQFLNLDWTKVSNWAKRWISRLSINSVSQPLDRSHVYFSNYATKQICSAIHKWLLNQIKYQKQDRVAQLTREAGLSRAVSLYDNPREPKVCGRRVWEGRGHFAHGTKFWEDGKWVFDSRAALPTRSRGTTALPEPTLCNLVFAPGKSDYVDTFAKSPEGIWIPSLAGADVSEDGIFTAQGFLASYDSQKNVYPEGNVKLMAPLFSMLANIVDVGRHLQWYHSIGTSDWLLKSECFKFERF